MKKSFIKSLVILALSFSNLNGQVYEFVVKTNKHRIIKDKTYIVETVSVSYTHPPSPRD